MTEQPRGPGVPRDGDRVADPANPDLPVVIDELVDELSRSIGRAAPDGGAPGRAIAFRVLSGWLRANRRLLSDPAKADRAETLISTVFRGAEVNGTAVDVGEASSAAERLAVELGDDFPMVVVWVAAGLAAQFE